MTTTAVTPMNISVTPYIYVSCSLWTMHHSYYLASSKHSTHTSTVSLS